MNKIERKMLELLVKGRDEFGYVGVKAEFEAEGTRTDELLRLVEIARKANLNLGLKIGGCEALKDLMEAKQIGVEYVIAPMIETPYALSKYIAAKNVIFSKEERADIKFLFNLETMTTFQNLEEIVTLAQSDNGVDGIVFGRSDFVGSMGKSRDSVNDLETTSFCKRTAERLKETDLELVVGGGVSIDATDALKEIRLEKLSRFETRKVIFDSSSLDIYEINQGLLNAAHFELLWLINKRNYYSSIQNEDVNRIETLQKRWNLLDVDETSIVQKLS